MSAVKKISAALIVFCVMLATDAAFADMLPLPVPRPTPWVSGQVLRMIAVSLTVIVVLVVGYLYARRNGRAGK